MDSARSGLGRALVAASRRDDPDSDRLTRDQTLDRSSSCATGTLAAGWMRLGFAAKRWAADHGAWAPSGRGAHGEIVTPGMILLRPTAMMSGPIPPYAPSRITPLASIQ